MIKEALLVGGGMVLGVAYVNSRLNGNLKNYLKIENEFTKAIELAKQDRQQEAAEALVNATYTVPNQVIKSAIKRLEDAGYKDEAAEMQKQYDIQYGNTPS